MVDGNDVDAGGPQALEKLFEALRPITVDEPTCVMAVTHLAHRAYRHAMAATTTELLKLLALPPAAGLPAARDVEDDLGQLRTHNLFPFGPLGGYAFGFSIDPQARRLSEQRLAGDPHRVVSEFGGIVARALTGQPRSVLGFSATAYLPGAPLTHVDAPPRWPEVMGRPMMVAICWSISLRLASSRARDASCGCVTRQVSRAAPSAPDRQGERSSS